MARLCQRAENEWVGVQCGIMDQMISAAGQADHALLIDCRSLETEAVPLPPGTVAAVLDTGTRRGLVDSAYNERRAQCEAAAAFFGVPALRDVSVERFEARAQALDEVTRRRARHVVTENARTLRAVEMMRAGNVDALGRLMDASHASLRDDFEVSSDELDQMVACARRGERCYGARMTGAGFGGSAVALVDEDAAEDFAAVVAACYRGATAIAPAVIICTATAGAEVVTAKA
jgi:galactokinase